MKLGSFAVVAFATALLTIGCTTTAPPAERTVRFTCDNGPPLTVVFHDGSATVTPQGGETVTLPQAPSGSGFLYLTPQHSLRGKGNEVNWTVGRMVPMQCRAV